MNLPRTHLKQRGVTLVEILVIATIVAAVAALLLPTVGQFSRSAKAASCVNNLRQVYTALMGYAAEHHQHMPPGRFIPREEMSTVNLKALLVPGYIGEMPVCPEAKLNAQGLAELPPGRTAQQALREHGSYCYNGHFTRTRINNVPGKFWGYPANYQGSHQFLFLVEGHSSSVMWDMTQFRTVLDGLDFAGYRRAPRDHGQKRLNFMFLDGHAKAIAPGLNGEAYDWSASFDSSGANGKYIPLRQIWNAFDE